VVSLARPDRAAADAEQKLMKALHGDDQAAATWESATTSMSSA
jgi:hypothetical protein